MSIQDLGSIGELVGAILLLASLIYLATQIRDTKTQIVASTSQARTAAFVQMWALKLQPGFIEVELKSRDDPDSLTEAERHLLINFLIIFMNFYQDTYYQRRLGTLDPEQAGALDYLPMLSHIPFYKFVWEEGLSVGGSTYSPDFVSHVNNVLGGDT